MDLPFKIIEPFDLKPILISVPHCGTRIPDSQKTQMNPRVAGTLPDTDWFVHELYKFASLLGITLIHAEFSRYVVDLNRPRDGAKLYQDGRQESGLIPTHTFQGEALYAKEGPTAEEAEARLVNYYDPYHAALAERLTSMRDRFENVLLIEGHSIHRVVPKLFPDPLPDLMLGSSDGTSADASIVTAAEQALRQSAYSLNLNHPFKGGFITRHFGRPAQGIHALQLEMSQDIYLDDTKQWHPTKAAELQETLQAFIQSALNAVQTLNAKD